MSGKSRIEKILENLLGENNVIEPPIGRDEKILYSILNDTEYTDPPHSIFEDLLLSIKTGNVPRTAYVYSNLSRDEKILFCKINGREYFDHPVSRLEKLLIKWLYLDLYITYDGAIPFSFKTDASYLYNYIIHGTANGVGDRSLNEIPLPHYRPYNENRGVVYESNSDGTVTANGTANRPNGSSFNILINNISPEQLTGKTYTMSANDTVKHGVFIILYFLDSNDQETVPNEVIYKYDDGEYQKTLSPVVQTRRASGNVFYRSVTIKFNDISNIDRCQLQIRAYDGTVLDNYVYKPMFFEGDSFMPFDVYNKYKLTVKTNEHLTSIPLDGPVYEGDQIEYFDTGIKIPTDNGNNAFDVLSDIKPERVELTYDPLNPVLKLGKRKTILKK